MSYPLDSIQAKLCHVLEGKIGLGGPSGKFSALWEACLGVSSTVRRRGRIGVSRQWRNLNMIISCE